MKLELNIPVVKGLLIDFDGTLVDTLPSLFNAYMDFLSSHRIKGSKEEFQSLIGPPLNEIVTRLKTTHRLNPSPEELFKHYRKLVEEACGELLPGVKDFLRYAQSEGLHMGVVTSAPAKWAERKLKEFGIEGYFSFILGGEHVRNGKPHPEGYLEGIKRLGIPAENIIAIEDSENGTLSAQEAGLVTLYPDWKAVFEHVYRSRNTVLFEGPLLKLSLLPAPNLTVSFQAYRESLWVKKLSENPTLFNGSLLFYEGHEEHAMRVFIEDYKTFLARDKEPGLVPLSVSGIVTYGGKVLIGKRANFLSQHPGLWECVPSGGLSISDPYLQIVQELEEETSIKSSQIKEVRFVKAILNRDERVLELIYAIELSDPTCHPTAEATELTWISPSDSLPGPTVPLTHYLLLGLS